MKREVIECGKCRKTLVVKQGKNFNGKNLTKWMKKELGEAE